MDYLKILNTGNELTREEAFGLISDLLSGIFSEEKIKEILISLNSIDLSSEALAGMAEAMRKKAIPVELETPCLDNCGTGGSRLPRFNVSTISSFVIASLDCVVAKHGNRAQSGRVGSFDLLENLGVNIELGKEKIERIIKKTNLGFLYAPLFHPGMKYIAKARKELGIKTVFNLLGPLANPAFPEYQVLGVSDPKLISKIAETLTCLKVKKAFVIHGEDGLDEFTLSGDNFVAEVRNKEIREYKINPEEFGFTKCLFSEISGGDLTLNIELAKKILKGKEISKRSEMVIMNSAFSILTFGKASSLKEAIEKSKEALYSGLGARKLEEYIDWSRSQ